MTALTRSQIVAVLGPVDDTLLAEIAATGASRAELMEAYGWVTNDEALVNEGRPLRRDGWPLWWKCCKQRRSPKTSRNLDEIS